MRRIKRTKITVIRTETVFLKRSTNRNAPDASPLRAELPETDPPPVLEIEAIEITGETEHEGEVK